jgi:hypothetical protein
MTFDLDAVNWSRAVVARRRIEQSPLSSAPAVPRGTRGTPEDVADDLAWIDFGDPFGVVACDPDDIAVARPRTGGDAW